MSVVSHGMYVPSLTRAIRCLTDGVNHRIFFGTVHTFTSERFSVSDGWCQSSDCHGMYMPSLTKVIRCLTDGLNQTILSTCTYFLLQVTLSVWLVLIVSQPRYVHTSTCQTLPCQFSKGRFPLVLLQQFSHFFFLRGVASSSCRDS